MIAHAPQAINTNAGTSQLQQQAAANTQARFPGWRFMDSQRDTSGRPVKAHLTDGAGHVATVWYDANEQVIRQADGRQ